MIYKLAKMFKTDTKEVENKFTIAEYLTYVCFDNLDGERMKFEMDKKKPK